MGSSPPQSSDHPADCRALCSHRHLQGHLNEADSLLSVPQPGKLSHEIGLPAGRTQVGASCGLSQALENKMTGTCLSC